MGDDGDEEAGTAADDVTGEHAKNEGLEEILPQHPQRAEEPDRDLARSRKQHRRHAEAAHHDLPQIKNEGAEQERDRQIDRARGGLAGRFDGGERGDGEPCGDPIRQQPATRNPRPHCRRSLVSRNSASVTVAAEQDAGERDGYGAPFAQERRSGIEQRREERAGEERRPGRKGRGRLARQRHDTRRRHGHRGGQERNRTPWHYHERAPMNCPTQRSMRSTRPISPTASSEAARSAAQICTVCP